MLATLTIFAVAVTDLIRLIELGNTARFGRYAQAVWWVVLALVVALTVRPEAWAGGVAALVAAGWYGVANHMDSPGRRQELFAWSAVVLVALVAGLAWLDVAVLSAQVPAGLLWSALALFLTQTGNRITRAVLVLAGRELGGDGATVGSVPGSRLKGGRVIGPLERMFIMILTVVGAYPIIAALMAAKGIVRFPEISADAKQSDTATAGTKAEEFLVGSLASWGLAGGAGLLASLLL